MKKTSEALSEAQEQATVRRKLLESGRIRLIPVKPKPSAEQEDKAREGQAEVVRKQGSR